MRSPWINLLCLPCAGASATMYMRWRRLLPAWIRVVPVELPGRGLRFAEPLVQSFDALVEQLCDEHVRDRSGHFALFGHSMGALLAYGMTQRLRALQQRLPCALFVSGSPAPSKRDASRYVNQGSDTELIVDLRRQGGTPDEVFENAELLRMTLNTLRADYRVCNSFVHRPVGPLPMPVHVFAGRNDDIAPPRLAAWQSETSMAYSLDWFEGGHFFIRQEEGLVLQVVVRELLHQFTGVTLPATAAA